ncbi:hypothetical protein EAI_11094 [Harpegnathos saltator]|uniref:Uncharacterized protein n=1 Tax=Harpegnathos saltator TaxID=610380 RepID=E2C3P5_HARSA|nr:hypothetical protein EAI_11094 [Harpegnathos saltator]
MHRSPQKGEEGSGGKEKYWGYRMMEELKEMKGGLKEMKGAMMEEVRKQGKEMKKELEELRKQIEEREREGRREREGMRETIERLEEEMRGKRGEIGEGNNEDISERMRGVERKLEMREREERRRNVVIGGLRGREIEAREKMREIFKEVGIVAEIEEIEEMRRIGMEKGTEEGRRILKISKIEGKKEIMVRRRELREKGIRIDDDLTWKERKMRWRIENIAREERGTGTNVWVKYRRIRIDGKWWRWNEEEDKLKGEEERIWGEKGEGKGGGGNKGENGEKERTEEKWMEDDVLERSRSDK